MVSEAVDITEPQVIPLAKRLKIVIGSRGVHRLAVPLSEQPIVFYPLVSNRSFVIVLP